MLKNSILVISFSFLLFSCGPNQSKEIKIVDSIVTAVTDSISVDTTPKIQIAELLGGDTIIPNDKSLILFQFDSKLIDKNKKVLSAKEVRKRFLPIDSTCEMEAAYTLKRLFELDSMKRAGATSFGSEGQTIEVLARVIDTLTISPNYISVVWTMTYHTYEACPYSAGTYYMLTTYEKTGKLISTQLMGLSIGGGDAPYSFSQGENGYLYTDGSFKSNRADTTEDGDVVGKNRFEITKQSFKGRIDNSGHIIKAEIELPKSKSK